MSQAPSLGVGMVGYAFMGRAHSQAWQAVEPGVRPAAAAAAGGDLRPGRGRHQRRRRPAGLGGGRDRLARADRPRRRAAGRHRRARQPARADRDRRPAGGQARAVREAARQHAGGGRARWRPRPTRRSRSGARAMVGFNYRRVPALALARRLVEQGRIGTLRHVRAVYLQDWLVDPDSPLTWRMQAEQAGSGALGDLGAHIVDLARFLTGDEITGVSALSATFVDRAPAAPDELDGHRADGHGRRRGGVHRPVRIGRAGLVRGDPVRRRAQERAADRAQRLGRQPRVRPRAAQRARVLRRRRHRRAARPPGFRRILVTEPEHPYLSGWWPPGHILGWEHTFTHQARDLLTAIADGGQPRAVVRRRAGGAAGA